MSVQLVSNIVGNVSGDGSQLTGVGGGGGNEPSKFDGSGIVLIAYPA